MWRRGRLISRHSSYEISCFPVPLHPLNSGREPGQCVLRTQRHHCKRRNTLMHGRFHSTLHVPGGDDVYIVWQIVVRFELWQWLFFFAFTVPIYLICRGVMKCIILFLEANFFETGQTLYYLFGIKASSSGTSLPFMLFDFSDWGIWISG